MKRKKPQTMSGKKLLSLHWINVVLFCGRHFSLETIERLLSCHSCLSTIFFPIHLAWQQMNHCSKLRINTYGVGENEWQKPAYDKHCSIGDIRRNKKIWKINIRFASIHSLSYFLQRVIHTQTCAPTWVFHRIVFVCQLFFFISLFQCQSLVVP